LLYRHSLHENGAIFPAPGEFSAQLLAIEKFWFLVWRINRPENAPAGKFSTKIPLRFHAIAGKAAFGHKQA